MANFRDVKESVDLFHSGVELLAKFRSELEAEKYDESSPLWFTVNADLKPWYFDIDWLGNVYRVQVAAEMKNNGKSVLLESLKLSVGLHTGSELNPLVSWLSTASIRPRRGHVQFQSRSNDIISETTFPGNSAAELFLAMIGQPLDL